MGRIIVYRSNIKTVWKCSKCRACKSVWYCRYRKFSKFPNYEFNYNSLGALKPFFLHSKILKPSWSTMGLGYSRFYRSTYAVLFFIQITCDYNDDYPRKLKSCPPYEVWSTKSRCWQIHPFSDCIIEDIQGFPIILDIIIDNSGYLVPDTNFRHGSGAQSNDNKSIPQTNVASRRRIINHFKKNCSLWYTGSYRQINEK